MKLYCIYIILWTQSSGGAAPWRRPWDAVPSAVPLRFVINVISFRNFVKLFCQSIVNTTTTITTYNAIITIYVLFIIVSDFYNNFRCKLVTVFFSLFAHLVWIAFVLFIIVIIILYAPFWQLSLNTRSHRYFVFRVLQ